MLLPREHLPLSTLDFSQPHGDLPASRFFESKIKILDLEGRLGSNVLLARSETTRVVYAIERDRIGLYSLCKLGAWVDMEDISQKATVVCASRMRNCKPIKTESTIDAPTFTPQMHKEKKRRRLAIEEIQSKVQQKRSQSRPPTPGANQPVFATSSNNNNGSGHSVKDTAAIRGSDQKSEPHVGDGKSIDPLVMPEASQPSSDDIFQNIRAQYFEALYHSMV